MTINTWHCHRRYGYMYPVLSGRDLWQTVPQSEADRKKQLCLLLANLPSQRIQHRQRFKEPGGAIVTTKGGCIPQHHAAYNFFCTVFCTTELKPTCLQKVRLPENREGLWIEKSKEMKA